MRDHWTERYLAFGIATMATSLAALIVVIIIQILKHGITK